MVLYYEGHSYRMEVDMIDVTASSYPDPTWRYVCRGGGLHAYYVGQAPATARHRDIPLSTPTLRWVTDGETWYADDDEPHEYGHYECAQCGEHITPGTASDTYRQMIPGIKRYYIDDEPVTYDELMARLPKELRGA